MSLIRAIDQCSDSEESFEEYYSWLSKHEPKMAHSMNSILEAINQILKDKIIYAHTSHEALVLLCGAETWTQPILRIQCQPSNPSATARILSCG